MCHHRDMRPQSGLLGGAERHGEDKPEREAPVPPGTREGARSEPSCRTSLLLSRAPSAHPQKPQHLTSSHSRERTKPSRSPPRTEKSTHPAPMPQDPKARDLALGSPSKKSAEQPHGNLGQRWDSMQVPAWAGAPPPHLLAPLLPIQSPVFQSLLLPLPTPTSDLTEQEQSWGKGCPPGWVPLSRLPSTGFQGFKSLSHSPNTYLHSSCHPSQSRGTSSGHQAILSSLGTILRLIHSCSKN